MQETWHFDSEVVVKLHVETRVGRDVVELGNVDFGALALFVARATLRFECFACEMSA
jgi:hypothetical protein